MLFCLNSTKQGRARAKSGQFRLFMGRDMAKHELAALVGGHYRIVLSESWEHERPEVRTPDRIWYEQIPCQGGAFIGLYSLDPPLLQLSTPRPRNAQEIFRAIKNTPGVKADFCYESEATINFPPEVIHMVAPLAGAKKKRRLSPEQKEKVKTQGSAILKTYRKTNANGPKIDPRLNDLWGGKG